jgi:hypothetical protein
MITLNNNVFFTRFNLKKNNNKVMFNNILTILLLEIIKGVSSFILTNQWFIVL